VVESGPYGVVRHPGYVGAMASSLGLPLFLGASWAFIPALATVMTLIARAAVEDRTLRDGLPGYNAYAARVRWRLLPGVW
jgi:protein-S-isoprenylcysteine O-methyltransferase Ste14